MENKNRTNKGMARTFAKMYLKAVYNKNMYGRYMLDELSGGMVPAGADEDAMVKTFEDAVEKLAVYPSRQSGVYYILVKTKYMEAENAEVNVLDRMREKTLLSESMVYRRLREALDIVEKTMTQADCFKEVKEVVHGEKDAG